MGEKALLARRTEGGESRVDLALSTQCPGDCETRLLIEG